MANEFIETHSGKHLDKYGVWIKKTPETKKDDAFDFFPLPVEEKHTEGDGVFQDFAAPSTEKQNEAISAEAAIVPDIDSIDFEVKTDVQPTHTVSETSDTEDFFNFDDSTGFAPIETEAGTSEVKEQDMSIDSSDLEEIDLDDFFSDNTPIVSAADNAKKEPTEINESGQSPESNFESVDIDDFTASDDKVGDEPSPKKTENTGLNLDIQFKSAPESSSEKAAEKSSASAFDDMLDELTGSSGDMVEVSLDDFFDDDSTPPSKPADDDEVQEIPEPKTTVEEFSLASIKSGNAASSGETETVQTADAASSDGFEDISLDDFFSDSPIEEVLPVNSVPTVEQKKSETEPVIDLKVEADDAVQEVSVTEFNEVENIDLFGNEMTSTPVEKSAEIGDANVLSQVDDMEVRMDSTLNEVKKDAVDEPLKNSIEPEPLSDLTAIVDDDTAKLTPESPDFNAAAIGETADTADEPEEAVDIADTAIIENTAFDDVSALTNDLLDTHTPAVHNEQTVAHSSAAPVHDTNEKTNALLMQLIDQMTSMKTEIADLKDEIMAVKEGKIAASEPAPSDDFQLDVNTERAENAADRLTDVEVPEIENFDKNDAASVEIPVESVRNETGFFSDDNSDETIALTGDELNNIISTADFMDTDTKTPDEDFDVPEVLNLDETFQADDSETSEAEQPENQTVQKIDAMDGIELEIPEINFDEENGSATETDDVPVDILPSPETSAGEPADATPPVGTVSVESADAVSSVEALSDEPVSEIQSTDSSDFEIPDVHFDETAGEDTVTDESEPAEMLSTEDLLTDTTEMTDITEDTTQKTEPEVSEPVLSAEDETSVPVIDDFSNIEIEPEPITVADNLDFLNESESIDAVPDTAADDKDETVIDVGDAAKHPADNSVADEVPPEIPAAEDMLPSELIAKEDEPVEIAPMVSDETDEQENFNTEDLDNIVDDIPMVDLDVQSLDKKTASDVQEQISTVKDEVSNQNRVETLPIDMKEEIKSVLTYMDQLLESLPEEKIEEFARSEYFETYKKLFEDLGIS